jgi:glycolate oxidase iron-sulfur subunit
MKTLKDFEPELNKCSKCGLCQDVCPIFKISKNDCSVSKGKFIMLHGVTKGDLKLSKNLNKYLDNCLKCGKCTEFCPSGIDACQILNIAKFEYMRKTFLGKLINFLESPILFGSVIKFGQLISNPFRPRQETQNPTVNVLYFKGCVNQICPRTDIYINKIFKNSSIEIIEPDFTCCGLPFLSEGNLEGFINSANKNVQLLNSECDFVVTDCASCASTISDYPKYINTKIPKVYNWGDLIAIKGMKFKFKNKIKVTFHKPCHLKNDFFLERILSNCANVEYIKMEDYDECCGFAGSFGVKNRGLSTEISKAKAKNITATNADYVITTCPSCVLGLRQGLFLSGGKAKVVSLLEFLAKADEIMPQS